MKTPEPESLTHITPRRGRWMVEWRSPKDGTIRQEWLKTRSGAEARRRTLLRGHIESELYDEKP